MFWLMIFEKYASIDRDDGQFLRDYSVWKYIQKELESRYACTRLVA